MNLRFSENGQAIPEKAVPITGEAFGGKMEPNSTGWAMRAHSSTAVERR